MLQGSKKPPPPPSSISVSEFIDLRCWSFHSVVEAIIFNNLRKPLGEWLTDWLVRAFRPQHGWSTVEGCITMVVSRKAAWGTDVYSSRSEPRQLVKWWMDDWMGNLWNLSIKWQLHLLFYCLTLSYKRCNIYRSILINTGNNKVCEFIRTYIHNNIGH